MPKAFLSHSSKDKGYVDVIANRLGRNNISYDSMTFEKGGKTIDEIIDGLESSDILVYFISNMSLESDWVKKEINKAEDLFKKGNIKKLLPLIIDKTIKYDDDRIPEWIREDYNLQYISRPAKATERIKQTIRIVTWALHPINKEMDQLFIGRAELIKHFEERIFNYELQKPTGIVTSGFPSIGRKKLLLHCLKNSNIIREYYKPPIIQLGSRNSIENFLLNVYDLGYSKKIDLKNLISMPIRDKVKISINLVNDIKESGNILFIEDNYCIVERNGVIVKWFEEILNSFQTDDQIIICLISRSRLKPHFLIHKNHILSIFVPGLNKKEREGLFQAYLDIHNIDLTLENFKIISNLFTGFPDEVKYAIDFIRNNGLQELLDNLHLITDYNSEQVSNIINEYLENDKANKLFRLFASYEFMSLDLVENIIGKHFDKYKEIIHEFSYKGIIEFIGVTQEYFRLNDSIKDFVQRTKKYGIPTEFINNIISHTKYVLKEYDETIDTDISDYINSIQFALVNDMNVNPELLIPSHFINTMRELYNYKRQYDTVIELADKVLENEAYLDASIVKEIRYWLCQALARKRDRRLLSEVQKIDGPFHDFILGFYYRLINRYTDAISRLKNVLSNQPNFRGAKRELVQVYLNLNEYASAFYLAEENFKSEKNNPYFIQSYFICLIMSDLDSEEKENKLVKLLSVLREIPSNKSHEMYLTSKAQFEAFIQHKPDIATDTIDQAIYTYPSNIYPRLTKLDICLFYKNLSQLENTIRKIESDFRKKHEIFNRIGFWNAKTKFFAYKGLTERAYSLFDSKVANHFPNTIVEKFRSEIDTIIKINNTT